MTRGFAKTFSFRVKEFVRENWGAPFIVAFMGLLVVAAASLSMSLIDLANGVAIAGYYALVVGVILQIVCFMKHNKRNGKKNYESS